MLNNITITLCLLWGQWLQCVSVPSFLLGDILVRHEKTDPKAFVFVIPKEEWARVAAPILLLVWHRLFRIWVFWLHRSYSLKVSVMPKEPRPSSFGMTTTKALRSVFSWSASYGMSAQFPVGRYMGWAEGDRRQTWTVWDIPVWKSTVICSTIYLSDCATASRADYRFVYQRTFPVNGLFWPGDI